MKKRTKTIVAMTLSCLLALSGCSFNKADSGKKDTTVIDDNPSSISSIASSQQTDEVVVFEEIPHPDFDISANDTEGSSTENSSKEPSTEGTTEETAETPVDDNVVMVFFGDSQIANGKSDGTDIPSLVSQRVPNSKSYNLAIGGTTAALEMSTSNAQDYENWTSNCFFGMVLALEGTVDRNKLLASNPTTLETMNQINPAEVDYYFIEYGANDFFGRVPLDKYSYEGDINEIFTYYGAICQGIDKLQKMSPNAHIIMLTPFYGIYKDANGSYLGDSYIVSNGIGTLADYAKKAINVAEDKELYILDTMFRSKCDLYLDTADQYLMDNIHLTLTGRQIFARLLAHVPNSYEGFEPSAYRQTENIRIADFNPDEYYKISDESLQELFPEEYEKYINGEYLLVKP
ncbi:SGNH/GDSL hydrolase family protein [Butyrivibrio sp. YAB3001]|uniref:SGNH/GDSL hydrolase family protein n=1 Tax=Butyrivibrio sp. YAB3001 TaxID=1520812 RepID=UPI0008F660DE|nr:SGNH/GDSL hydrolase family protein [Butyrivibrio sp. YAB3001]SFC77448.1 GDSL-like Lipase/Acylhydrolase family [Butyrivibrio sp. YAB3001]